MRESNTFKKIYRNTHLWIVLTCIGVWFLVIIHLTETGEKNVYVKGGLLEAEVTGNVGVRGNVSVDNTVDVNLYEINGYRNCFYNSYSRHPNDYYRIPVSD